MAGDTLQKYPDVTTLLASVMLARPFDGDQDDEIARLKARPGDRETTDPLRLIYERARAAATHVRRREAPGTGPRWQRAFEALLMLRHRQRAAIALTYVAALPRDQVARALGVRERELPTIMDAGLASIARFLGEPADVRGALRRAGARLLAPEAAVEVGVEQEPTIRSRQRPVDVLLGDIIPVRRRRLTWRRAMSAAALFVLVIAALVPTQATERPPVSERVERARPAVSVDLGTEVLPQRLWRVQRGDTLWSIAARALDDPRDWPKIWAKNRMRVMLGGRRFDDPDHIRPGWTLVLPASG